MLITYEETIIFQYPQDFQAEHEWLKDMPDGWYKIGCDTQGAIYRHRTSFNIPQLKGVGDE